MTTKQLLALYDEYAATNEKSLLAGNGFAPEQGNPIEISFSRPTFLDVVLGQPFTSEGYANFQRKGIPSFHLRFKPKRGMNIKDQEKILFGVLDSLEKNGYSVEPEDHFGDLSDRQAAFERAVKNCGGGIWLSIYKDSVQIGDVVFLNVLTGIPEVTAPSIGFSLYTVYPYSLESVSLGIKGNESYKKEATNLIEIAIRKYTADAKKIACIVAEEISRHYRPKLPKSSIVTTNSPVNEPVLENIAREPVQFTAEAMKFNLNNLRREIPASYLK